MRATGDRQEEWALDRRKLLRRNPLRRRVLPGIRHRGEPIEDLRIQIRVAEEGAAVEKAVAEIADGALHFAFGLRATAPHPHAAAPVSCEAEELEIVHEAPARESIIAGEDRSHLVE